VPRAVKALGEFRADADMEVRPGSPAMKGGIAKGRRAAEFGRRGGLNVDDLQFGC